MVSGCPMPERICFTLSRAAFFSAGMVAAWYFGPCRPTAGLRPIGSALLPRLVGQLVRLDAPLKSLGIHTVRVALHPEVFVQVSVNVARSPEEAELQANPELAAAVAESEREAERLEREVEEAEGAAEAPRLVLPE